MNWEAIGAIGEIVGAAAVVVTLIILIFQIRHNTTAREESNRLEKAFAIDRHSDTIARWRGRLIEDGHLAELWLRGRNDDRLDETEKVRLNNLWIDFVNTQRANFLRAITVGETGLARQAVLSIAAEKNQSKTFQNEWDSTRAWNELTSGEFVRLVEETAQDLKDGDSDIYRVGSI